ncbi:hypothetical protein [Reinekea blandensis]|uniref:Uncharacterized protein n=1 Tax=Reinekea blandensis MED297 TaxID=314283 RepID=A4BC03_9GAMM|nr:hypothetical protein [Reinekea blandensis]EAR10488.1 hypothetical protein MED297_01665 [Reinekea sp. MED297] [Reinekea blandensis MED297]
MLTSEPSPHQGHTSNLLFMRRRQAADLLLALADGPSHSLPERNLLLDALYQLPTGCFIADDWTVILTRVTRLLLLQEDKNGAGMPTHLSRLLAKVNQRLAVRTH